VTRQHCCDLHCARKARGHLHSTQALQVVQEPARERVADPVPQTEARACGPQQSAMETSASESGSQLAAGDSHDLDVWSNSDADSSYGDLASETASLTSSILTGHYENGRRYHAYQASREYILPDDEEEQDRLDVKYASLQLVFSDKVTFAPIENPQQILDIGTGTGIWAIDAGEQFPSATVTAIDLSPIQPTWCVAYTRS
jgi:2-polyprenyl-3-methyl-5-hydroxy-6-metoxy-1,4-benzoquinol methylase